MELEMTSVPREGEYLLVRSDDRGPGAFRVLYVTYLLDSPPATDKHSRVRQAGVEIQIEPVSYWAAAEGGMKRVFDFYNNNERWTGKVKEYPYSGY